MHITSVKISVFNVYCVPYSFTIWEPGCILSFQYVYRQKENHLRKSYRRLWLGNKRRPVKLYILSK